jgi:hypothetical protein
MARKSGMTIVDENHAPGRKRMVRANGRINVYWVAAPAAVKAGYRPKTVPLNDDPGDVIATMEIAARCRALWAEMLEFMAGAERGPSGASIGTIAWIVDLYQIDQDSPIDVSDPRRGRGTTARWRSCARPSASAASTR